MPMPITVLFMHYNLIVFSIVTNEAEGKRLVQHGGPPGWLEVIDPAGCDFVCDGRALPYSTGVDLTGAAQLRADRLKVW
jgi:hypothetical protein